MYRLDVLIQGYPGKTSHHGGLGWSTVALLRGHGEVVLIDTGSYSYRDLLVSQLDRLGLAPTDVTSIVLTHCHWDHICNFPLFPRAKLFVPHSDLEWAIGEPVGALIPELHVEALATHPRLERLSDGDEPLPGLRAVASPGHTPGHLAYLGRGDGHDLVFAGDAVKNQAELMSEQVDMTMDLARSQESVRRLRALVAEDPQNVLVCGHDRLLGVAEGQVVQRSELRAGIAARLTQAFEDETAIDLVPGAPGQPAHA